MSSLHPGTKCRMKTLFILYSLLIVAGTTIAITIGLFGR
jgi:hypothetical protein